jgi:hypothetical protein
VLDSVAQAPANVAALVRVMGCDEEPIGSVLDASSFELAEEDEVLSPFEASRMIMPAERRLAPRTALALDLSGSITRSGMRGDMIDAARVVISSLDAEDQVAVYGFDGRPDLIPFTYFTADRAAIETAFAAALEAELVDDSTNLYGAVDNALHVLDEAVRIAEQDMGQVAGGSLVVFTDGADHAGRLTRKQIDGRLDDSPHSVFAVGVGPDIDTDGLREIGRSGTAMGTEPETLRAWFAGRSRALADRAAMDYVVSYCSPARAGERTLEIRVTYEERFGRAEIDFDATGFGAGCAPEASPLR